MLELRALRLFIALAEERHFGRTAERNGIAQSVLSAQIARIEDRIGTRLFERGRRAAVTLTPAGRTFLTEARATVAQAERAERIGRMAGRGEAGQARIGYVLSAALSGLLPARLAAIRQALPLIEIEAVPMETPEQIAAIADGRLDLGFIRPRAAYPAGVSACILHREAMLIALPAADPLAERPRLTAAQLADATFIFPQFGDSDGFSDAIARLAARGGFTPRATLATRDFVTALSLCAAGYGVVLTPLCMTKLALEGVVFRPLTDHRDEAHLAMLWSQGTSPRLRDVAIGDAT